VLEDVSDRGGFTLANPAGTRDYDGIEVSLSRRLHGVLVRASYTYSRTFGDDPGFIRYESGQIEPNRLTTYDDASLAANSYGALPQDRTHYLKLDAAYAHALGRGVATIGTRLRALSGTPVTALGPSFDGNNEVYLLPRGSFGRGDGVADLDVHLAYSRGLPHHTRVEVFADVFSLFDAQDTDTLDLSYALESSAGQTTRPIDGGSYADLIWLKQIRPDSRGFPEETSTPIQRNPHFRQPSSHYGARTVQLGARLAF
jgi:hypothetical protein